ncbi:MAG TPA: hypothetical protein VIE69_06975 [Methylophilaceae bacterium]|jgi:hypothetical protein
MGLSLDPTTWYDYIKQEATALWDKLPNVSTTVNKAVTNSAIFGNPMNIPILLTTAAAAKTEQVSSKATEAAVTDGIKIASDPFNFLSAVVTGDTSTFFSDTTDNAPNQKALPTGATSSTAGTMPFWVKAAIVSALLIGTVMIVKGNIENA